MPLMTEFEFNTRKAATQEVIDAITKAHGPEAAEHWAWEMTPIPCGLPSDEQLAEGWVIALSPGDGG